MVNDSGAGDSIEAFCEFCITLRSDAKLKYPNSQLLLWRTTLVLVIVSSSDRRGSVVSPDSSHSLCFAFLYFRIFLYFWHSLYLRSLKVFCIS